MFDLVFSIFILFFQVGVRRLRVRAVKRLAVSAVSGRVLVALRLTVLHVKVMAMVDGLSCDRASERARERESARWHFSALHYPNSLRTVWSCTYIGSVTKWLPIFYFWLEITENCVCVFF